MKMLVLAFFFVLSFTTFAGKSEIESACSPLKLKKEKTFTGKSQTDAEWINKYSEMESEKASTLCLLQRINKELNRRNQNPVTYDYQHNFEVLQSSRLADFQELQDQIDTIEMKEFMLSHKEIELLTQKFKNLRQRLLLDLKQLP